MIKYLTIAISFLVIGCAHKMNPQENYLMGILYTQRAAEHTALTIQTYNLAEKRLLEIKRKYKGSKKPAVVLDVDETVLDNSPYQGKLYVQSQSFDYKSWQEWINTQKAHPVVGALSFTRLAHKKGFKIFYLTNRSSNFKNSTIENLKKLGFPQFQNTILRSKERSKEGRRENIKKKYNLVMLIGDNLTDFSLLYDEQSSDKRKSVVMNKHYKKFGTEYFMLPNPMYGDWDKALLDYKKLDEAQKRQKRTSELTVF